MSYLVLARKWRPQTFADLIGQEHVSQTLGNAIRTGRVHHAFLFTGARGVGKTSAARIFAKALNCEQGITAEPCNQCPSCLEISEGNGTDVLEIDGASNTGVDDVRELRENIRYLPSRSRFKIFIIDEVHMLSINAFNALLKTLEEPPDHAKFIFATTEPHKIPITILSRCQRFDFRKIPLPSVVSRLKEIVEVEKVEISERALTMVARRGEGSMRDALSTLDQVIAFCGDRAADEDVQGLLGLVDRRLLLDTVEALLQRDSRRLLEMVRRVDHLGYSYRQYGRDLVETFRSLVLCRVLDEPQELLDVTADELAELQALAAQAGLEDLQRIQGVLLKLESELAVSPMPHLTLEMVLLRLAQLPPTEDVGQLLKRLAELEKRLSRGGGVSSAPVPRSAPSSTAAAESSPPPEPTPKKVEAPAAPNSGKGDWPGLVEFVKARRRPLIASILEQASPLQLAPPILEIGLPRGSFALGQLDDPELVEALTALAGDYFGAAVKLRVTPLAVDVANVRPSLEQARRQQESDRQRRLRADALDHPLIKSAQDIFGASVKDVRPIDKGFV
ncbi:DNA polymerase III subunit gamma/tau [Geothermobacter hydrogeniphilus]|uniref:DNA polymerase III subunit gamma/tau n=1 Tax=Geothermobacter hydrogeniphilus TaxID=1969733 RepID=A0A2K2HBH0_9BACT|nr:DNA polymerase III subunit gamma/tau [Geothermobacter hydrogeniphilus]PNU20607.1 DNA polymerase III subunit gamma/tau [Geothermobacter hydrogeniphilus]